MKTLNYNDIIKDDNQNLREKSIDVDIPLNIDDFETLIQMNEYLLMGLDEDTCEANNIRPGVGLAAPQVNVLKRMITVLAHNEKGELFHFGLINPKIISHSEEKTYLPGGEGCLSVDRTVSGYVHRAKRITVRGYFYDYSTHELTLQERRFINYIAVVVQHEIDHLNGILFYDHFDPSNPYFIPSNSSPIQFYELEEEE